VQTFVSGHSVYKTEYHIVWCTKYRRRILNPGLENYLRKLFPKIIKQFPGVILNVVGFDSVKKDHVHFDVAIPPKYAISSVVGAIKSQSSSELRKKFDWLKNVYKNEFENILWSPGFYVSTVGINEAVIRKYVEWQGIQDLGQAQTSLFD